MTTNPRDEFRGDILAALGAAPEQIEPGVIVRFGPRKACWCKLFDDLRGGVFGDWRSGATGTWSAADRGSMTRHQRTEQARQVAEAVVQRQREQRQQWADNAQRIARLWSQCVPLVPGDPVTLHLKARGFGGVWPLPACLRLHRGLDYWHEGKKLGTLPAMVAPLVAPAGATVALHRTYLCADGRKADVPTVRKLTGTAGPLAGACIPLDRPHRGVIGIAEGIETALAAGLGSGVPTVAAANASLLAAWQWPAGVQRLVIFADNDRAGREAADALRARVLKAWLHADVLTPTGDGADWADVWVQAGAADIAGAAA
jgi:putative DNA primase/helicase